MTDDQRAALAGKLGLVLLTRVGSRSVYLVDDSTKPARPGWKPHYPKEPPRLVPRP